MTDTPIPADEEPLVLYLLMRSDLASMNTGKACAQAHHAGTQMALKDFKGWKVTHQNWLGRWQREAGGFGTVLCMGVNERTMRAVLDVAARIDVPHGIVNDPTYPLIDGDVLHLFPLDTCAYVFGPKVLLAAATHNLDLHP